MKAIGKKQLYTIVFNDGYEKHISAEVYEVIKERLSQGEYAIEIDSELLNLKYYKRITQKRMTDDVEEFIMQQSKGLREKLLCLMKLRQKQFPYKQPFESVDQVKRIIEDMRK